jgi:hypothetical protein
VVARILLLIVGATDVLAGGALLLTPRWFFENIGTFPPYSSHFLGDAGAFLLPIGVALVVAATNPLRHRSLITLGTAASVLHFFNHLHGSVVAGESWLQTIEVGVFAAAMVFVVAGLRAPRLQAENTSL